MKFPVAYYLLFLYLSVIIRPFILMGCDIYDHAFEEAIHIATVHAKYGSNHLEVAVADTSKENNNKSGTASKSEDTSTAHFLAKHETTVPSSVHVTTAYPDVLNQREVSIFLSILAPPPKA